ncbi:hypothetical protein CMZ84_12380 [Lysobacteraceae bacterium NML93-0399]|nr:hypothetical protein CMZ84_12380 [Xanthomonadaceae bacterium NML93-0399]
MTQDARAKTAGIAFAASVLLHAGLAWWLWTLRSPLPVHAPAALTVVWIDRAPPPSPPADLSPAPAFPAAAARPPAPSRERPLRGSLQAVVVAPSPSDSAASAAPGPGAAELLEQAGAWARSQTPAVDFAHDTLRHRVPPTADGRFAMRRGVSPEDVVRGIGQLLGGAGYTTDPCPQIRRNIANAGNGDDPALAAEEVRRLQRFCL